MEISIPGISTFPKGTAKLTEMWVSGRSKVINLAGRKLQVN